MIGSGQADAATIRTEPARRGTPGSASASSPVARTQSRGSRRGARCQTCSRDAVLRQPHALYRADQGRGCKIICSADAGADCGGCRRGADVITTQRRDADGHSGTTRGTMALVPAVVDAVAPIPGSLPALSPMAVGSRQHCVGNRRDLDGHPVHRFTRMSVGSGDKGWRPERRRSAGASPLRTIRRSWIDGLLEL
jgi:hypothetical protein